MQNNQVTTDYTDFTLEHFLADPSFRTWAKGTADANTTTYWQQVIGIYPQHEATIGQAVAIIRKLSQPSPSATFNGQQLSWKTIETQINGHTTRKTISWIRYAAVAAAIVLLAVASWLLLSKQPQLQQQTLAAQRQRMVLPDSSVVTLGANSSLSYNTWQPGKPREVWLKGEAYFEINHLNKDSAHITPAQRFLVHVNDNITVEVLGTVFLVRNRRGKTAVSLESGSVKVNIAGTRQQQLMLKPGETVELNPQQNLVELHPQKDSIPTQWRSGNLMLNNTSVREILQLLEDNYNRTVKVASPELLDKRVDGILPLNNEQHALMALSSILDAEFREHTNGTLVLKKN
ncbi:FecR family protein [Filimonas effusa]|uniref:DUF4974 domain-containing protein n=1 Tax=Filimonas effusa TaxID=2508721 RepID=A0A4Q1D588_9BACT|nr:FecR domain-containing protein [Filimonas effusa]RXK83692.1 DUF4974 domain-containing protein [Filimonas effusa]